MRTDDILDKLSGTRHEASRGLTILIDPGLPAGHFRDVIESHGGLVDLVKFGWGTALVTGCFDDKLRVLNKAGIRSFFGGTLFELAYRNDCVDPFFDFAEACGCDLVEISDGTVSIPPREKSRWIQHASSRFEVFSEIGYKNPERSEKLFPAMWIEKINDDLESGASHVVLEARESGNSGICRPSGEVRHGLIHEILDSGIDRRSLVFEAPNKMLQTYLIKAVGPDVNLANVAFPDVVGLETLRLGLRSDTMDF